MYQLVKERPGLPVVDGCTLDDFNEVGHCGDYLGVVVGKCGRCLDCHDLKSDLIRTEEKNASEVQEEDRLVFPQDDGRIEVFKVKTVDVFPGRFMPVLDAPEEPGAQWYRFSCYGGPVAARDMDDKVQVITA